MAEKEVYEFLQISNRPYNANDIISNLNKQYTKTVIQNALNELVQNHQIMEKINAKQKIYCNIQASTQNPKDLMKIDKELQVHANELEETFQNLQKQIKKQEATLENLRKSLTIEEILEQKENLNRNIKALNKKLDNLMTSSSGQQDLPTKKRKLEKDLDTYQREYNKRKRKCLDVIDCILENYPKNKQNLYDEVGLDIVNV